MSSSGEVGDKRERATIVVRGRVSSGLGEGTLFTQLPWAKTQFVAKLGIDPFPGTFNVMLEDPEEQSKIAALRARAGVEIVPDSPEFCSGITYPAVIAETVQGAAVFPAVAGYPADKLEIIAPVNVKNSLKIADGDYVFVELSLP